MNSPILFSVYLQTTFIFSTAFPFCILFLAQKHTHAYVPEKVPRCKQKIYTHAPCTLDCTHIGSLRSSSLCVFLSVYSVDFLHDVLESPENMNFRFFTHFHNKLISCRGGLLLILGLLWSRSSVLHKMVRLNFK